MYRRAVSYTLENRLTETRHFMQIVMGPRQTGKTTAVKQALQHLQLPTVTFDAGSTYEAPLARIAIEWEQARLLAQREGCAVLFIDEIQKAPGWADAVKVLWDEDSWNDVPLHVVISGSSSLLLRKGLSDSLKGRFEVLHSTQWFFPEMEAAFDFTLDDFLLHGGYPGAAALASDQSRWLSYMNDSIIQSTIANDILQLERIYKPALLKRLFELGSYYSGQEMSYRKVLGQLDDKGNTDIIAHYLTLLETAGMLTGLQKYYAKEYQTRRSSPRFMVYDTALMTCAWRDQAPNLLAQADLRGRLIESAVGAYLLNRAATDHFEVNWWREGSREVDFIIRQGKAVRAIEVKSGRVKHTDGLAAFIQQHPQAKPLVIGGTANPLEALLRDEIPLF